MAEELEKKEEAGRQAAAKRKRPRRAWPRSSRRKRKEVSSGRQGSSNKDGQAPRPARSEGKKSEAARTAKFRG
jgi:hypothetical protein